MGPLRKDAIVRPLIWSKPLSASVYNQVQATRVTSSAVQ